MSQTSLIDLIQEATAAKRPAISLEFFPPKKAENLSKTKDLIRLLAEFPVDFMTVTYGAGGSTRGYTQELATYVHQTLKRRVVSHLTCVGHSKEEIEALLKSFSEAGIKDILALRGDAPVNADQVSTVPNTGRSKGFSCARDLIRFIKTQGSSGSICAAGYPEVHKDAVSAEADLMYLKEKVDAGAEVIITQLFFDPAVYFAFVKRCRGVGITVPIVPGIMPIRDYQQLTRFTSLCGASIPLELREQLEKIKGEPEKVIKLGTTYAINCCRDLISGGAPGIHLYTLNQSDQVLQILAALQ